MQEWEANLFVIFPGWTPADTGSMSLEELMRWHRLAEARAPKSN